MIKDIRHTGSFVAAGKDGSEQILHVFTEILDAGTRADPEAEIEGLKQLRTEGGDHVNRLDKGKYQVVTTEEILLSDDPNAL